MAPEAMRAEKRDVARNSVLAALAITAMKIVVGVSTGSLGILSEAAHSLLDLIAAVITLLSVRVSDKPADADHQYGHGKVENFSAFIETGLLLLTCFWILWEAGKRLFFRHVEIEPSVAAFVVMVIHQQLLYLPVVRERFRLLTPLALVSALLALGSSLWGMQHFGGAGAVMGVLIGESSNAIGIVLLCLRETAPARNAPAQPAAAAP